MKFKVLCTAPLNRYPEVIKYFHMKFDGEIVEYMSYDDLVDKVHQFSGLIPNARIPVSAEVIENATRLKAIYQPSMGFEHIDVEKLKTKKIKFNALGIDDFRYSLWSTAEHALSLLIMLMKESFKSVDDVRSHGSWDNRPYRIKDFHEITVGVIGYGNIGSKFAKLCTDLGAKVIVFDPYLEDKKFPLSVERLDFKNVLIKSDFISLHVPLNQETKDLIGEDELNLMKNNACIINTSRGGVINENELLKVLQKKLIYGAALDVLENESPFGVENHPLVKYATTNNNLIITPHLGGSSFSYMEKIFKHSIDQIEEMLKESNK